MDVAGPRQSGWLDVRLRALLEQALTLLAPAVMLESAVLQIPIVLVELVALLPLMALGEVVAALVPTAAVTWAALLKPIAQEESVAQEELAVRKKLTALAKGAVLLVAARTAQRVLLEDHLRQCCGNLGFGSPLLEEPMGWSVRRVRQRFPLHRGSWSLLQVIRVT